MQKYKVEAIKNIEGRPGYKQVVPYDSKAFIVLPNNKAETLKIGDKIFVAGNRLNQPMNFYFWRNGIDIRGSAINDKLEYKWCITSLDGIFDGSLERLAVKMALIAECHRRNLGVSLLPWRNLQKICQDNQNPGR